MASLNMVGPFPLNEKEIDLQIRKGIPGITRCSSLVMPMMQKKHLRKNAETIMILAAMMAS